VHIRAYGADETGAASGSSNLDRSECLGQRFYALYAERLLRACCGRDDYSRPAIGSARACGGLARVQNRREYANMSPQTPRE
jgi:hypothetical protein